MCALFNLTRDGTDLRSFTRYLEQTLVFMSNRALREKFNLYFPGDFW